MVKKKIKGLKKMVAPPRKLASQRVRAVRDDKGDHHDWADGREATTAYKTNKRNNVNWSDVRCRAGTCWKTKTRKTDKTGVGAYKKNVEGGHYKGQLRRKPRTNRYVRQGGAEPTGTVKKLRRQMKTDRFGRRVPLPMRQQTPEVRRSWGMGIGQG